jgi:hypothetical protein
MEAKKWKRNTPEKNKGYMTVFYIVMVCHATLPDERFITPR